MANKSWFMPTFLKGTNCTISLIAFLPLLLNNPLSPSSLYILLKSALPMPTIIIERGRLQLSTNKLIVLSISCIYPSVNINNIWYVLLPYIAFNCASLTADDIMGVK